jgi:ABC-type phosphate/phosphonate transport system substrate-binding protein
VLLVALVLGALSGRAVQGQQAKIDVLHVGTSGTLTGDPSGSREKTALETLQSFIKEETGLDNDILRQKSWRELADKMSKQQLHLGVFQGYEFAWAQEQHPKLKPLAVAVNVYTYPLAYLVVKRDNPAKDFAGLKGQSLAIPATGALYLNLFAERQAQHSGKALEAFFSKVSHPDNVEDALDDVVDGVLKAVVTDRAALEAYKRRKPGRFQPVESDRAVRAVSAACRGLLRLGPRRRHTQALPRRASGRGREGKRADAADPVPADRVPEGSEGLCQGAGGDAQGLSSAQGQLQVAVCFMAPDRPPPIGV